MDKLPLVSSQLQRIKYIANNIKNILKSLTEIRSILIPDTPFTLDFHFNPEINFYVMSDTIYMPVMTIPKLNGLPAFLPRIEEYYAIEHEVCHLLDLQYLKYQILTDTDEVYLEIRAEHVEHLLIKENYDSHTY